MRRCRRGAPIRVSAIVGSPRSHLPKATCASCAARPTYAIRSTLIRSSRAPKAVRAEAIGLIRRFAGSRRIQAQLSGRERPIIGRIADREFAPKPAYKFWQRLQDRQIITRTFPLPGSGPSPAGPGFGVSRARSALADRAAMHLKGTGHHPADDHPAHPVTGGAGPGASHCGRVVGITPEQGRPGSPQPGPAPMRSPFLAVGARRRPLRRSRIRAA